MRRQLILHLICINLLAAAWIGVLIKLRGGNTGAAGDPPQPEPRQAPANQGSPAGTDPALVAEKAALEAEIGDLSARLQALQEDPGEVGLRIQIPMAFFDAPGHFLSPFIEGDTGEKFRELLQIDEAEGSAVDAAVERAIQAAQEFESAKLNIELSPEGFLMYRVPAWGDLGRGIVGELLAQVDRILGAERSAYYVDGYVIKELLREQDQELRITARPAGGDRPYPSLQVQTPGPASPTSSGGDYMVWLTGDNPETDKFIGRYGQLLGVESAAELTAMVSAIAE